jgi:sodium transport system permease protein
LTEALRDRRTLITTFLVPLLMIPVLGAGFTGVMSMLYGNAKKEKSKVMVLGGADSPNVVESLKGGTKLNIVPTTADWKNQIVEKEIRAAVEIPEGFQGNLANSNASTVKIYIYKGELKSELAALNIETRLKEYRDGIGETPGSKPLAQEFIEAVRSESAERGATRKEAGAILGGIIAYMLIFMCLNGAMHPAIDLTTGEKEGGSMELFLSRPVRRTRSFLCNTLFVLTTLFLSPVLLLMSVGISTTILQKSGVLSQLSEEEGEAPPQLTLKPTAVASVIIMAIPLSVLFSAGLIAIALFAKSYKEAQSYISPLMFVVVIPAVAAMLPGVDLTPKLAIVPLLNVSLLCKELVTGEYHWNYIVLIFASTCVYAAGALYLAVKMFQRESVLFRS